MDPYTAAFNAIGGAVSTPPAGPSEAKSAGSIGGAGFDNSGWNITFGNESAIATERTQAGGGAPMDRYAQYALIGGAILLGVLWLKKR